MSNSIKQELCIMFNPFSFIFLYLMIKVCLSSGALSDCLRIPLRDLMRGWGILCWHYLYLLMKCLISPRSPGPDPPGGKPVSQWGPSKPESTQESDVHVRRRMFVTIPAACWGPEREAGCREGGSSERVEIWGNGGGRQAWAGEVGETLITARAASSSWPVSQGPGLHCKHSWDPYLNL